MVECSTSDKGVVGYSFSGGTVLCPCARHAMLYLVLVQPRIQPDMTENFLTGIYRINSNHRGLQLLSASVLDL